MKTRKAAKANNEELRTLSASMPGPAASLYVLAGVAAQAVAVGKRGINRLASWPGESRKRENMAAAGWNKLILSQLMRRG